MPGNNEAFGRIRRVHPYAWLWVPLESDPGFVLGSMFGTKVAYLDGKLMLCFAAKDEPWRGILVCTERAHHPALRKEYPALAPHPVLGKWLYIPEAADVFEATAGRLVERALRRDLRIGVVAGGKGRKRKSV
jgi:hypothetical protein